MRRGGGEEEGVCEMWVRGSGEGRGVRIALEAWRSE